MKALKDDILFADQSTYDCDESVAAPSTQTGLQSHVLPPCCIGEGPFVSEHF